jgi:hypothetical protein
MRSRTHTSEVSRKKLDEMVWYAGSACRRRGYWRTSARLRRTAGVRYALAAKDVRHGARQKFAALLVIKKGGFSVGAGYVADVLIGGRGEKLLRQDTRNCRRTATAKRNRQQREIGRELVRQGHLGGSERFNVLEATENRAVLAGTLQVTLLKRACRPRRRATFECDEVLFETLRRLRKGWPMRGTCRLTSSSRTWRRGRWRAVSVKRGDFSRISGRLTKLREFGTIFLKEIAEHVRSHPRQMFRMQRRGDAWRFARVDVAAVSQRADCRRDRA